MHMWLKSGDAILTCVLQKLSLYSDTVTSQLCVIKQRQPFNPSSFAFYCLVSCLPLGFEHILIGAKLSREMTSTENELIEHLPKVE